MHNWKNTLKKTIQSSSTNADIVQKPSTQHHGNTSTRLGTKASDTSVVLKSVRNFSSLVTNFKITSKSILKRYCIHVVLMDAAKDSLQNVLGHTMKNNIAFQIQTSYCVNINFHRMAKFVAKVFKGKIYSHNI